VGVRIWGFEGFQSYRVKMFQNLELEIWSLESGTRNFETRNLNPPLASSEKIIPLPL